jgi:hypothetical protein
VLNHWRHVADLCGGVELLLLQLDAHGLEDHLHGGLADGPAPLLVEPLEALLEALQLVQVKACKVSASQKRMV